MRAWPTSLSGEVREGIGDNMCSLRQPGALLCERRHGQVYARGQVLYSVAELDMREGFANAN